MNCTHDVIVIGSGLAGLTAATCAQQEGFATHLIERLPRPGGLCGGWTWDGGLFPRSLNDLGYGAVREMKALGVDVDFAPSKWKILLNDQLIGFPLDAALLRYLLPRAPRLAWLIFSGMTGSAQSLGELVQQADPRGVVADFVNTLPAMAAQVPATLPLSDLRVNLLGEHRYGYHRMVTPVGGGQALTDGLVKRFLTLGGVLSLERACTEIQTLEQGFVVQTPQGPLSARHVITSQPRWDVYPANAPEGLHLGVAQLLVDPAYPFPEGVDALYFMPENLAECFAGLDQGKAVKEPSFNFARCIQRTTPEMLGITVYVVMPRGELDVSPSRQAELMEHFFKKGERLLPGLSSAIKKHRFISPREFAETWGLSSCPLRRLRVPGQSKPPAYDPKTRLHYIGNSVEPTGEHATGAIVSGRLAAMAVSAKLRSPH